MNMGQDNKSKELIDADIEKIDGGSMASINTISGRVSDHAKKTPVKPLKK